MSHAEQQQQQQSESRVEDLSAPQSQEPQQPTPAQDDAVKGGIIIVGGYTGASYLQSSYTTVSSQQLYFNR